MSGPSFSNPLPACLSVEAIVVVSWFAWVRYGVSFQFRKNLQASERFRKEIRLLEAISGFKIKGQRQDMSRRSRRRYVTQLGNASPKNSFVQERPYPHIIARSSRDPGAKLIFSGQLQHPHTLLQCHVHSHEIDVPGLQGIRGSLEESLWLIHRTFPGCRRCDSWLTGWTDSYLWFIRFWQQRPQLHSVW
jgi:hypothetical protein